MSISRSNERAPRTGATRARNGALQMLARPENLAEHQREGHRGADTLVRKLMGRAHALEYPI